jgi:hypothetical protein
MKKRHLFTNFLLTNVIIHPLFPESKSFFMARIILNGGKGDLNPLYIHSH